MAKEDVEKQIIELFETHTIKEMAEMFAMKETSVRYVLTKNRIRKSSESRGAIISKINRVPIGTIHRWARSAMIKVDNPSVWIPTANYAKELWEKENGKIPEGMRIDFLNGDDTDIDMDNLVLIKW